MAPFPQIDHYMGRKIEAIEDHELGWALLLEGGVRFVVTDSLAERPLEEHVVGKALQRQDLSAHGTTLWFGTDENRLAMKLILTPNKYAVAEPNYEGGLLVNPQQPEEYADIQTVEPVAPGERSVEGPDEEGVAERELLDPQLAEADAAGEAAEAERPAREAAEAAEAERLAQEAAAGDETDPRTDS
jgi:hypothetical protein